MKLVGGVLNSIVILLPVEHMYSGWIVNKADRKNVQNLNFCRLACQNGKKANKMELKRKPLKHKEKTFHFVL